MAPGQDQKSSTSTAQAKPRKADDDETLVRNALLEQARSGFDAQSTDSDGAYARRLKGMQDDMNAYLARHHPEYKAYDGRTAIVLNPGEFVTAMALGEDAKTAVRNMLAREGVTPTNEALADIATHMKSAYSSRFGSYGFTQSAEVREDANGRGQAGHVYVMTPATDGIGPNRIPGMPYTDNMEFINRHEAWHIKDAAYDLSKFPKNIVDNASIGFAADYFLSEPRAAEAYSMAVKKEALADVSAVGDMMRDHHMNSFKLLNQVADWRASLADDDMHLSTPVLKGMKAEIEKMGFGNFLKMNESQAQKFYRDVTEKYGLNAETVCLAAEYDSASPERKRELRQQGKDNPEMQKALEFMNYKNRGNAPEAPLTEEEAAMKKKVEAYGRTAQKELLDNAFRLGHKITPETIVQAHREMEDALLLKAEAEDKQRARAGKPPNPLYRMELAKLQQVYVSTVQGTNYIQENEKRGVDIREAEPALKNAAPKKPATTPA